MTNNAACEVILPCVVGFITTVVAVTPATFSPLMVRVMARGAQRMVDGTKSNKTMLTVVRGRVGRTRAS
jgi:hypothetical protein